MSAAPDRQHELSVNPQHYRRVIGSFSTGVAVVTTELRGCLYGMTVNSLTSVSLEPCLLLFCARSGSATGVAVAARRAFAVSILGKDQIGLCRRFVGTEAERFGGLEYATSESGLPLLPGAIAHLCCTVADCHGIGDHEVIVGRVEACSTGEGAPLVFHRGSYGTFAAA